MISRRQILAGASALALTLPARIAAEPVISSGRDPLQPLFDAWKEIHVSSTGRVIDRLQDSISHSEGQGYALMIAAALGDRAGFELLLGWTLENLAVRPDDSLLAWRWDPTDGGSVTDLNNATDGDIFAAWALLRAAERFDAPEYRELAMTMARDIVKNCVVPCPGREDCLVLLPGTVGFYTENGAIINPAYYMFRALTDLGAAAGLPELETCAADGIAFVSELSRTELPPDWSELTADGFSQPPGRSGSFGYEAMRVPLYLVWSGLRGHPAVTRAAEVYTDLLAGDVEWTPTVINPANRTSLETSTDPGYRALAALSSCAAGLPGASLMPAFSAFQPYYPSVLHLLSLVALRDSEMGCYL